MSALPRTLKVLDHHIACIERNCQCADPIACTSCDASRPAREARAAVAALVEAARNASATLGHAYHTVLTGELAEQAHTDYQRLDAALSNIEGGKA